MLYSLIIELGKQITVCFYGFKNNTYIMAFEKTFQLTTSTPLPLSMTVNWGFQYFWLPSVCKKKNKKISDSSLFLGSKLWVVLITFLKMCFLAILSASDTFIIWKNVMEIIYFKDILLPLGFVLPLLSSRQNNWVENYSLLGILRLVIPFPDYSEPFITKRQGAEICW